MWLRTRSLSVLKYRLKLVWLGRKATMFLLLLTLTLGVAEAGNLFYEVQQQEQLPPADGLLCPDQASKCPNTATCCQLSSGEWGCCPFAQATCCGDNVHCCPSGYSCNKAKEQCVRAINNDTMPWAKKEEAGVASVSSSSEEAVGPINGLTCADGKSVCAGTASCCRTLTGSYRCCKYPNTVCCSNGDHCCPRCSICDQLSNRCINGFETEKWETMSASTPASLPSEMTEAAEKLPANVFDASVDEKTMQNVVWCDRKYYCWNGYSCCRHRHWTWSCCPYRCGSCCRGGYYCCPYGKRCVGRYCY